jgi:antitoxin (DNA-binding transcriptional repressor) of toxin-antitoxin stability system
MDKVINIYEAKTNFSKLVKKAQAGETIYVGAYGQPQAIIAPAPQVKKPNIGVWKHKKTIDYKALVRSDNEIANWVESD